MRLGLLLIAVLLSSSPARADVRNPVAFIGEYVFNAIFGAPLSVDANGQLQSGIPDGGAYNDSNFTCTTTDQVITGVTIAAPPAGTMYEITMSGDVNGPTSGQAVSIHFESNGAATTHGALKFTPFAGGTLTFGSQRIPFSKSIITSLNGTSPLEVWCSTSTGTATTANVALIYARHL